MKSVFKRVAIALLSSILILTVGCSNKESSADNNPTDPKQVVKDFFKYENERNHDRLLTNVTGRLKNSNWGFEDREYIKLKSIKEEKILNETTRVYFVDYEVKYYKGSQYPEKSGKYKNYEIWVTREDINSPWLISQLGGA